MKSLHDDDDDNFDDDCNTSSKAYVDNTDPYDDIFRHYP